ncbi:hypothetical protein C2W64_02896 [Brevibacillus laterosporus]|nr:hypothetical protein C2W64_02896 [Brevibacillus laterosporus]
MKRENCPLYLQIRARLGCVDVHSQKLTDSRMIARKKAKLHGYGR